MSRDPAPICGASTSEHPARLLIGKSRHIVQDGPLRSMRCTKIPEWSAWDRRCQAAWQRSRRNGFDPRPSAFQAGHIPSWRESYESYAPSPAADDSGWLLLLLSPLLSAVGPVPISAVSRLMTA